jgi:hypothetical protein
MKVLKKIKWFFKDFEWMKVYFSPFKPPIPKFYIGKVAIGTPYFYPRVWVKATPEKARKAALEQIERIEKYGHKTRSFDEIYQEKLRCVFHEPKKIGFDFVPMRWKTKWKDTDYRYESPAIWSFVFFKWQIAVTFCAVEAYHFWEAYLYYSRNTKGSTRDRIKQARKEFPCIWKSTRDGVETTTCYWGLILKNKFRYK